MKNRLRWLRQNVSPKRKRVSANRVETYEYKDQGSSGTTGFIWPAAAPACKELRPHLARGTPAIPLHPWCAHPGRIVGGLLHPSPAHQESGSALSQRKHAFSRCPLADVATLRWGVLCGYCPTWLL